MTSFFLDHQFLFAQERDLRFFLDLNETSPMVWCHERIRLLCSEKRSFSWIRRDENYRPKKTNIILLCLSMELSMEETTDLLERAGYCFSDSIEFDQIARYFIQNKIYDIYVYRDVLYRFGLMGEELWARSRNGGDWGHRGGFY